MYDESYEYADTCKSMLRKENTSILPDCPGAKLFSKNISNFEKCCETVESDPECGRSWFFDPSSGFCVCEIIDYDCIRLHDEPFSEHRQHDRLPSHVIHPGKLHNKTNNETSGYFKGRFLFFDEKHNKLFPYK